MKFNPVTGLFEDDDTAASSASAKPPKRPRQQSRRRRSTSTSRSSSGRTRIEVNGNVIEYSTSGGTRSVVMTSGTGNRISINGSGIICASPSRGTIIIDADGVHISQS